MLVQYLYQYGIRSNPSLTLPYLLLFVKRKKMLKILRKEFHVTNHSLGHPLYPKCATLVCKFLPSETPCIPPPPPPPPSTHTPLNLTSKHPKPNLFQPSFPPTTTRTLILRKITSHPFDFIVLLIEAKPTERIEKQTPFLNLGLNCSCLMRRGSGKGFGFFLSGGAHQDG